MMSTNMVSVLCRFGGDLIRESINLYYKGGTNRIVHVDRAIDYHNLLFKVRGICKLTDISSIKYKYPGLYLDSLVSIVDDDDISNMMEAFPKSSELVQLFISGAQDLSKPITISSNRMQNADNGNVQASLWGLHESNKRPSTHNINTNNNDVPGVTNDLHRIDCLSMDSSVNGMPKMMSILNEGQEFKNANAFDKALREYAIRSNFQYK
ncbi:protein PAL OF QUIRKY-like [Magnolia sinica]|uniref:protein PAL OF QUIRKY-like n=1 Tax=Magnolia sinica TaxID=86752 RepID=UPI00265A9C9F|nr:protein PAL OF QUIRKY-like [Magnolia sinica]